MNNSLERVVSGRAWEEVECAPVTESTAIDPRVVTRHGRPGQLLAGLIDTVEAEIVPRLVLARRSSQGLPDWRLHPRALAEVPLIVGRGADQVQQPDDVLELADLLVNDRFQIASSFVEGLRSSGVPLETLYLDSAGAHSPASGRSMDERHAPFRRCYDWTVSFATGSARFQPGLPQRGVNPR